MLGSSSPSIRLLVTRNVPNMIFVAAERCYATSDESVAITKTVTCYRITMLELVTLLGSTDLTPHETLLVVVGVVCPESCHHGIA